MNKTIGKHLILALSLASIISLILGVMVGDLSKGYWLTKMESKKEVQESKEEVEPNWNLVKNADFDIDLEKMNVVLIKRSFNKNDEVTLVQYENGNCDYFVCSMEIHDRLVRDFREILRKRKSEGN